MLRCCVQAPPPPSAQRCLPACLPGTAPAHICNANLKFRLINDLPFTAGGEAAAALHYFTSFRVVIGGVLHWRCSGCRCSRTRFVFCFHFLLSPAVSACLSRGHNQRMEFLGDSIMQLVATEYLFIHFPDHHEGHLTVRPAFSSFLTG